MPYAPSAKELSHFPFLKKSQEQIREHFPPVETLLQEERGRHLTELAVRRINSALGQKKTIVSRFPDRDEDEIAGYVLARIIASCTNDRQLMDRLVRYESERAYFFLHTETGANEDGWNEETEIDEEGYTPIARYLAGEFGIAIDADHMAVTDYTEIVAPLHDPRFNLINRQVQGGRVAIKKEERYELLRERIRVYLRRDLPLKVPKGLCEQLAPVAERLKKQYQEQMLRQFGTVEESAFPPCMQALITALTSGVNLTHAGRFSLTAFLHNIGMNSASIAEMYARSPDFDAEKTMYQVEHITGRGGTGTEYTTPACAAMQTTALCVNRDPLCGRISHPLSYYKTKKAKPQAGAGKTGDTPKKGP